MQISSIKNTFLKKEKTMSGNIMFYVVEFLENDGSVYSMAIKTTYRPSKDDVEEFLKEDMQSFGFNHVYDFYEVDEEEVYAGYDTDNIDNWLALTH